MSLSLMSVGVRLVSCSPPVSPFLVRWHPVCPVCPVVNFEHAQNLERTASTGEAVRYIFVTYPLLIR